MNDFDTILEITSRMKGFAVPPPKENESSREYHARVVNAISYYFVLLGSIHAIAHRNKS